MSGVLNPARTVSAVRGAHYPRKLYIMIIKTYTLNRVIQTPHFFILNKGKNSGRPMYEPCPNCFIVDCVSIAERDRLFWICYALWQSKQFYPFMCGSVIDFIKINDVKSLLRNADSKIATEQISSVVKSLLTIADLEAKLQEQIKLTKAAKICICKKYFN